ncbi:MAG TPA: GAF domain-containing sensor histidine kinase, partial [Elusimicrobiota bacterium]|nr:GAF domain-containing sensor histidine kinase [Elusimicrobiota bacterium]
MQLPEQDLDRILEAARMVSSTLRLPELLQTVMKLAGEVVRSEAASILLMDPSTEELFFDVALGEKGEALQRIRLKKGEGIAGWVAAQGQPALVNDVTQDSRWTQRGDLTSQFKTRAILAVPMKVRDKLVGVMEAINRADGAPFSELDVQVLETFASQAAVAIENARLFESIRQEKEKLATIIGEMNEAVLFLDAQGRVLLANPSAERLFDRRLVAFSWPEIEQTFAVKPPWSEVAAAPADIRMIEIVRKAPPTFILAGVMNPVADDRGAVTAHLLVVADVTEERREAQLKRNFLALVSHKLKTPLVAIRGFTPLLLEKTAELTSFQKTAIETIDRNSALLASLVEKLVWFAALEGDKLELTRKPHSILSMLDMALSTMAAFLRTMEADIQQDPGLSAIPDLNVDKIWMKEAFRNLIENAVKFNPKAPRQVCIAARLAEGQVSIDFTDNGPGIPSEEREKIFQKFYQIESSFTGQVQGMGLGLALVKRVVEEHDG